MTLTLGGSAELLGLSLAYTCARLSAVQPTMLDRPTPCARWRLGDLLTHMSDALDAFTEAAGGAVAVSPAVGCPEAVPGVPVIQRKAVALRAAWTRPAPGDVVLESAGGALDIGTPLLVGTAALEITVHGWDVAQATGEATPVPAPLAAALLPIAHATVSPADRGVRFARPLAPDADTPDRRLLAFLGRGCPGPVWTGAGA